MVKEDGIFKEDETLLLCEMCGKENAHLEALVLCKDCKAIIRKHSPYGGKSEEVKNASK